MKKWNDFDQTLQSTGKSRSTIYRVLKSLSPLEKEKWVKREKTSSLSRYQLFFHKEFLQKLIPNNSNSSSNIQIKESMYLEQVEYLKEQLKEKEEHLKTLKQQVLIKDQQLESAAKEKFFLFDQLQSTKNLLHLQLEKSATSAKLLIPENSQEILIKKKKKSKPKKNKNKSL